MRLRLLELKRKKLRTKMNEAMMAKDVYGYWALAHKYRGVLRKREQILEEA